jgi:hypothetical protein
MAMRQRSMALQKAESWLMENPDLETDILRDRVQHYHKSGIESQYAGKSLELIYLRAIDRHLQNKSPVVDTLGDLQVILIPRAYYKNKAETADRETLRKLYVQQLPRTWFEDWLNTQINKARIQVFVSP